MKKSAIICRDDAHWRGLVGEAGAFSNSNSRCATSDGGGLVSRVWLSVAV